MEDNFTIKNAIIDINYYNGGNNMNTDEPPLSNYNAPHIEDDDINEADGINEDDDINEADNINEDDDINAANGINGADDINEADGINEADDINEADVINDMDSTAEGVENDPPDNGKTTASEGVEKRLYPKFTENELAPAASESEGETASDPNPFKPMSMVMTDEPAPAASESEDEDPLTIITKMELLAMYSYIQQYGNIKIPIAQVMEINL